MCMFIFVGVPRKLLPRTSLETLCAPFRLNPIAPDSGYLKRVHVDQAFPKDTQIFALPGPCQCSLINAPQVDENSEEWVLEKEKQASKLRKSGWSEARIERWFAEKVRAEQETPGLNPELAKSFLEFGEKFGALFVVAVWTPENVMDFDFPKVKVRSNEFLDFARKMEDSQLVEINWKAS